MTYHRESRLFHSLPKTLAWVVALAFLTSRGHAETPTGLDAAGQLVVVKPSASNADFTFVKLRNGVQIQVAGMTKNVLFYGAETVRVNANLGKAHTAQPSLTVVGKPADISFVIKDSEKSLTVTSVKLEIVVNKQSGALTFQRPDGTVILRENQEQPAEIKEVSISDAPTYEVKHSFTLTPEESLYGLGQYNQGYLDYRGKEVLLVQTNIGIVVPFLLSTKRYGILWDIYSKGIFKDDASGASFWAESAPAGVDYYFIAGQTMDDVIVGNQTLTGKAPMFPKSAFGLFMSKERYQTQEQVIAVTRKFREQQIPLDNIVQDWQYWGGDKDGTWSGMIWNKERFPDPAAMTKTLHEELHVKLMISIWPSVGNDTELAHELDAKGLRFAPLHWISKRARIYDAFSPEGRAIYFKYIKKGLLDVGVDSLWMDGTEVEVGSACHDPRKVEADIKNLGNNALGDFTRYLNPYSLLTTKGTYEGQRATSNKRVLTLTRSSFIGQQRYAALAWSGDTTASYQTFRDQIAGGVNVAMAGQPYWTQDTGGFFIPGQWRAGRNTTPAYNELFARWHQFGAFNPLYRIHGTAIEREPYVFKDSDPEVFKSLMAANNLRYQLLPYIYSLAWRTTNQGYTMMRGLAMDFPDDRNARAIDDQFMFGPAFLVHPVTRPMYRLRAAAPATIPADAFHTTDGNAGIAVQYYEGRNFEKPAGRTVDPKVDYTWPGPPLANPPPGLNGFDNFSARWQGIITMPEDGEYEIGGEGDDGVHIWLDDQLIVDDWGIHPMRWKGQTLPFHKGQNVAVRIEYFQEGLGRGLRMGWRTPSERAAGNTRVDNELETYLPAGSVWYDFWTNERHAGGTTIKKPAPLDQTPLFVRAGSIVPFGPVMQYATEKPDAPYEVRIYPGADARFVIYEDDSETYDYEKGQFVTTELAWNDAARTLTIGKRSGFFPGMIAARKIDLVIMGSGRDQSVGSTQASRQTVSYTGDRIAVKF